MHNLKTYVMGHATGVLLAETLSSFEDNEILLSQLQYLESGNLNINKTI